MHLLLNHPFSERSCVGFKKVPEADPLLDYLPAAMAHALLRLSKIVKVRNNALQFTKEGKKYTQDNWQLFQSLFRTFATNYNKGYIDYYGETNIGNVGFLYVVYLLARFRETKHEADFYAGLYFKAFPDLTQEVRPILNSSSDEVAANCFKLRVFTRGLSMFGLIEMITLQKNIFIHKYQVRATPLFRKVFEIK